MLTKGNKLTPLGGMACGSLLLLSLAGAPQAQGDNGVNADSLYASVWSAIRDRYVDPRFGGQDWSDWENRYKGRLRNTGDAYRAIRTMLDSLHDPYTRLLVPGEPERYFTLSNGGAYASSDSDNRPNVTWKLLPGNIGYIKIANFKTPACVGEFKSALLCLSGAKALMLDLRDNRGGLLKSALQIADMLLPSGDIVTTTSRKGTVIYTSSKRALTNQSLVVLTNSQSASATEIIIGALKDNNRATIIGDTTYGKGMIQDVVVLPGGAELHTTIAKYQTPCGYEIDHHGVVPDVSISLGKFPSKRPDVLTAEDRISVFWPRQALH